MDPTSPQVVATRVVPVAGRDSMLLNPSGAHAPFFTRNLAILTDSAGRTGVGEMPGGEAITEHGLGARDDARAMQCLVPGWTFDPKRPCLVR